MDKHRVFKIPFASVYPLYVQKAEKKGRRRPVTSMPVIVALWACSLAVAQRANPSEIVAPPTTNSNTLIRAASLREDVAILRRAYESLHPGLYRYNTPAQVDAAFLALGSEFRQDRTLAQAYLAFSVLAAKVKCGHTYLNFFNQSDAVQSALFQAPRVPFYFRWLGQRMIVTRSFASDRSIRPGTEVLALNDVPVATILARLMTVAPGQVMRLVG